MAKDGDTKLENGKLQIYREPPGKWVDLDDVPSPQAPLTEPLTDPGQVL